MKNLFLIVLYILCTPVLIFSQDVRNVNFGYTPDEVKESENAKLISEEDTDYLHVLIYKDNIAGFTSGIYYIFAKDTLTRIRYSFINEHSNRNLFIDDFNEVDEILVHKYGEKEKDNTFFWNDDLYKDDPSEYGMAVAVGDLTIQSKFQTDKMQIFHSLKGDNYKINHAVEYQSKIYKDLELKAKEEANLSDF